jgi:signal transduction histidine kinase
VQPTLEATKQLSEGKNVINFDNRYLCKDGSYRWLSWTSSLDKKQNTIYGVARDIEARKQMEDALKLAKIQAESANRAKSEFLANMSHEIRTPMNAVMGFSEILSSRITDKEQKSYLQGIQTAGNTLLDLINDILDLSQIEAGRLDIQYKVVNPYDIFNELKTIFAINIAEKKLEFLIDIDKDLLPALILDKIRLRQVLLNIIGNAIKFTENGYIKLSAQTCYKADSHNKVNKVDFIIAVADTGIGISEDQLEMIFESFRQHDGQNTRKYGGTGLGLAICKRLVEMMNGRISVKSKVGVGSVFEIALRDVELPITKSTETQDDPFDLNNSKKRVEATVASKGREVDILKNITPEIAAKLPELIRTLEKNITPIWEEVKVVMEMDAIKDFADKIIKLGEEYKVSYVTFYGNQLREFAQHFDVTNIEKTLNGFPEMIKQLKKN